MGGKRDPCSVMAGKLPAKRARGALLGSSGNRRMAQIREREGNAVYLGQKSHAGWPHGE